jgi:acetyl esterase
MASSPPTLQMDPQFEAALRRNVELQREAGTPGPGIEGVRRHMRFARQWWNEGGPAMHREIEADVPIAGKQVRVVVYVPTPATVLRPAYLFLHGGGFRVGDPRSNDRMMRELAAGWGGIVVSIDYVHLPEHVFPQAVIDTAQVYQWIAANGAAWGIDGSRLAFGGTSSGANVALGAAIHLGAAGTAFLKAAVVLVGTFDTEFDDESMQVHGDGSLFPTQSSARATLQNYVPDPAQRDDPRVNCVAADLSLLPPLFIAAAELDVFRDSSRRLAAALTKAGRPHRHVEYPGVGHLFAGYSRTVDMARRCCQDIATFLAANLQ